MVASRWRGPADVRAAFVVQLATTLPLVGLIWLVQVVAYPLFARVGTGDFAAYHAAHSRLITVVVGPLMLGELVGALAWVVAADDTVPRWLAWVGLALVAVAWLVTAFASVPQHEVLSRGFEARAHALLVSTNWLRTFAWTARGALLLWLASLPTGK
jgi:hypothetical protein